MALKHQCIVVLMLIAERILGAKIKFVTSLCFGYFFSWITITGIAHNQSEQYAGQFPSISSAVRLTKSHSFLLDPADWKARKRRAICPSPTALQAFSRIQRYGQSVHLKALYATVCVLLVVSYGFSG